MISKSSAPGKVILFGEHFVVYGTNAILCAIDKRVTVTSRKTKEEVISVKSELGELNISRTSSIKRVNSPLIPFIFIAQKMIKKFNHEGGIRISINSDIPPGVGLGSSSACCVAAAASISGLFGKYTKKEILNLAIDAEKTIFKNTSGADCTVCTFGGIIEYNKKIGFKKLRTSGKLFLIIANTKVPHSTKKVVLKVKKYKEKNKKRFEQICREETMLIKKVRKNLQSLNFKSIGKAMTYNQKFLNEIGISNKKLQRLILAANKTSFGSKITGAGDGGCVISMVDKSNLEKTLENLKNQNHECFAVKIDSKGLDTF